jgi:cyclase
VHLPERGVVFAGDVVFRRCTPIGWQGTFASWQAALDRIAALEPAVIVPGHGPLCGVEGATEMRDYLGHVFDEARHLHARGVPVEDAARRIDLGPYADWTQPERLAINVARAYRELEGDPDDAPLDLPALLDRAVALREAWQRPRPEA